MPDSPAPFRSKALTRLALRVLNEIPAGMALCAECWHHVPQTSVRDGRTACCAAVAIASPHGEDSTTAAEQAAGRAVSHAL